jgi:hypothetical protein
MRRAPNGEAIGVAAPISERRTHVATSSKLGMTPS